MENKDLHFEKAEEKALDNLVKVRLFASRDKATMDAILKYATDKGVLNREVIWKEMEKVKKRKVTPKQLAKDLETLEYED